MSWVQTASGRAFDLVEPDWRQVDFGEMGDALARIARFGGHIGGGPYSVAQHSVLGADAIHRESGDIEAAAAFLLHDGHEAYLGDKTSPVAEAEVATGNYLFPGGGALVKQINQLLKQRIDIAIYKAAGLGEHGCPFAHRPIVKLYDLRMLATERAQLMAAPRRRWHEAVENAAPIRLQGKLTPWPWPRAADEFRERLDRYLPGRVTAAPLSLPDLEA
jgi:hypothetical protein